MDKLRGRVVRFVSGQLKNVYFMDMNSDRPWVYRVATLEAHYEQSHNVLQMTKLLTTERENENPKEDI